MKALRANWFGIIFLPALVWGAIAPAAGPLQIKVISTLDKFEPFEGHLYHADALWVGRSRQGLSSFYQLEVYDSEGRQIAVKPMRHSLRYIYAYGPNSVLIVGIAATPNHSFYTIATKTGSQITTTAYDIPEEALADRWAGRPGELYFTDPGGFDDGSPIGTPLRTIFRLGSGRPEYLQARIPGPATSLYWNNALYVLVDPSIGSGGKGIVRVDLQTGQMQQILSMAKANLSNMILLPDTQQLAVSDEAGGQVVLVDLKTLQTETFAVKAGSPRGLAALGHCLVVGSEQARQISFIDRRPAHHDLLAQWDLSPAGDAFLALRDLAVDAKSGRAYGRSAYPCTPMGYCADARNSVILAEDPSHEAFNKCTLNF